MKRKRKVENVNCVRSDRKFQSRHKMTILLRWWISLMSFAGVSWCGAVQVSVRDDRRFAMLFQSVVLPCQFSSVSTQTPVIQWWYKSYCRDRTRDAFSFPETLGFRGTEQEAAGTSYRDCSDRGRMVRVVASSQGSSITLAEYYKGRDISIINKADLRIGELQWGDSGIYSCKVVIADDLEGQNEAQVELLVLGKLGVADDLLPEFEVQMMPEWAFVGSVVLGSVLFILLVGVCWCQCCPHSCCCYVRCCCCPETCCCPRHLYEAGKGIKTTPPTPIPMYPPFYMQGMPAMVPIAPPSLIDPKMSAAPSIENNATAVRGVYPLPLAPDQASLKMLHYVERELAQFNPSHTPTSHDSCSQSELSSLHEVDTDFRQTYRQVQRKALPAIPDMDDPPDLYRERSPVHGPRAVRNHHHGNRVESEHPRWNPRSEHLPRRAFQRGGRTGSLDELEEFAMTYVQRGRHGDLHDREEEEEYRERERERERLTRYRDIAPRYHADDSPAESKRARPLPPSPPPLPGRRRGTWDSDRPIPRRDASERSHSGGDSGGRDNGSSRDYDDTLLTKLLERKARAGGSGSRSGRAEDDSDTPSRNSSKKSSEQQRRNASRSPSNRPEESDSLPPYSERELERCRGAESAPRPFTYTHSAQAPARPGAPEGREDKSKPRKVNTLLSRDSLIV